MIQRKSFFELNTDDGLSKIQGMFLALLDIFIWYVSKLKFKLLNDSTSLLAIHILKMKFIPWREMLVLISYLEQIICGNMRLQNDSINNYNNNKLIVMFGRV